MHFEQGTGGCLGVLFLFAGELLLPSANGRTAVCSLVSLSVAPMAGANDFPMHLPSLTLP